MRFDMGWVWNCRYRRQLQPEIQFRLLLLCAYNAFEFVRKIIFFLLFLRLVRWWQTAIIECRKGRLDGIVMLVSWHDRNAHWHNIRSSISWRWLLPPPRAPLHPITHSPCPQCYFDCFWWGAVFLHTEPAVAHFDTYTRACIGKICTKAYFFLLLFFTKKKRTQISCRFSSPVVSSSIWRVCAWHCVQGRHLFIYLLTYMLPR